MPSSLDISEAQHQLRTFAHQDQQSLVDESQRVHSILNCQGSTGETPHESTKITHDEPLQGQAFKLKPLFGLFSEAQSCSEAKYFKVSDKDGASHSTEPEVLPPPQLSRRQPTPPIDFRMDQHIMLEHVPHHRRQPFTYSSAFFYPSSYPQDNLTQQIDKSINHRGPLKNSPPPPPISSRVQPGKKTKLSSFIEVEGNGHTLFSVENKDSHVEHQYASHAIDSVSPMPASMQICEADKTASVLSSKVKEKKSDDIYYPSSRMCIYDGCRSFAQGSTKYCIGITFL